MSPADPAPDLARGRRDFSFTVLKLSRLLGGGLVSLATICAVSPEMMSNWVLGIEVPNADAWAKLLAIAAREETTFSQFAQAYVVEGQLKARRVSGFIERFEAAAETQTQSKARGSRE